MNFTDNPQAYQFNPYIDTLATDALVRVEMTKEEQFKQGFEKIQGQFQSIMGLPIAKEETRQYMQSKLSQLKNNIASTTTGDFSDMRLINQIGGLTGRIANDPIVQNGVQSTVRIQGAQKRMEEDIKAGKVNPYNQQDFNDALNTWVSDGRADSVFEGDYYTPVDYMEKFLKKWNEKSSHANSQLTQQDVRVNTQNGTVGVLNQREHEGVSPAEVNSIWQEVMMDPSVQRQLSIESRQKFKTMDGENFASYLKDSYQSSLDNISSKIKQIQEDATLDKTVDARQATQYIEQLKKQGESLTQSYNNIGILVENGDLDAAKHAVYTSNLSSMLMSNYSWSKDKDQILSNPLFDAQLKQANYELDLLEFDYRKKHDRDELAYKYTALTADSKSTKTTAGTNGSETTTHDYQNEESSGVRNRETFLSQLNHDKDDYQQSGRRWIFKSMKPGKENPIKLDPTTGRYEFNVDKNGINSIYTSKEQAIQATTGQFYKLKELIDQGKLKNESLINEYKNTLQPLTAVIQQKEEFVKKNEVPYQKSIKEIESKVGNTDYVKVYQVENKLPGWEGAEKSLQAKYGKGWAFGMGIYKEAQYGTIDPLNPINRGPKFSEYKNAIKALEKEKGLINSVQELENIYKGAQSSFIPSETIIHPKDAADKDYWQTEFSKAANNYNPSGSDKGTAADFMELVNLKTKEGENKQYSIVHDQNTRQWSLKVSVGDKSKILPLKDEKVINEWGFKTTNEFWDKYGSRLYLSGNTTTDHNGAGESNAFFQDRDRGSKYQVRYQLEGDGRSKYSVRVWVRDAKTGQLLLGDENIGEIGEPAQIMQYINNPQFLRSDLAIDGLLAKYNQ